MVRELNSEYGKKYTRKEPITITDGKNPSAVAVGYIFYSDSIVYIDAAGSNSW